MGEIDCACLFASGQGRGRVASHFAVATGIKCGMLESSRCQSQWGMKTPQCRAVPSQPAASIGHSAIQDRYSGLLLLLVVVVFLSRFCALILSGCLLVLVLVELKRIYVLRDVLMCEAC